MAEPLPQTTARYPATLIEQLGPVIANVRASLHNQLGTRPYRVFLVTREWSGGERGRGDSTVTRTELGCGKDASGRIAPPRFTAPGLGYQIGQEGVIEVGTGTIDEIDPTMIEAQLSNLGRLDGTQAAYIEVRQDARDGGAPDLPVRRFALDGAPMRLPTGLQWTMRIRATEPGAPFGNGQLGDAGGTPP